MSLLSLLRRFLSPRDPGGGTAAAGRGIILFAHTGEVIRAEGLLKKAGLPVSVKAPPPALRTGCDMVIEYPLVHELLARRVLDDAGLKAEGYAAVSEGMLEPVSIFQQTDFGEYLMVRAANMKITVEKASGRIVNVSGGGCPDVPYLAACLVGKNILEAEDPLRQGQTLCGYSLQLAFEEAKRLCAG